MEQTNRAVPSAAWVVLISVLALVPMLAGCGQAARAKPLEVTYYYLPG